MERYTRIELLTPERANALLGIRDPRQRRLVENHAQSLARAILLDEWDEDFNQTISISDEGLMMDGQHRCRAVVIAGKPIKIKVEYNVPHNQFKYYDRIKPRNAKDFYFGPNRNTAVAIATRVCCIKRNAGLTNSLDGVIRQSGTKTNKYRIVPTMDETLACLIDNEQYIQELTALAQKIYKRIGGGSKSMIGFALWVASYVWNDADTVRKFVEDFSEDVPTSPSIVRGKDFAYRLMLKAKAQKATLSRKQIVGLVLTLFDSYKSEKLIRNASDVDKIYDKYAKAVETLRRASEEENK